MKVACPTKVDFEDLASVRRTGCGVNDVPSDENVTSFRQRSRSSDGRRSARTPARGRFPAARKRPSCNGCRTGVLLREGPNVTVASSVLRSLRGRRTRWAGRRPRASSWCGDSHAL